MKTQTTTSFAVKKKQHDETFGSTRLAAKKKMKKTMNIKNTKAHATTFARNIFAVKSKQHKQNEATFRRTRVAAKNNQNNMQHDEAVLRKRLAVKTTHEGADNKEFRREEEATRRDLW